VVGDAFPGDDNGAVHDVLEGHGAALV
jgi:hypothetical protein